MGKSKLSIRLRVFCSALIVTVLIVVNNLILSDYFKNGTTETVVEEKATQSSEKEKIRKLEEDYTSMNEECLSMYHNKEYMDAINRAYKFKSIYLEDYENGKTVSNNKYINKLSLYMDVSETIKFLCHAVFERDKAISEGSTDFERAKYFLASMNPIQLSDNTEWKTYAIEVSETIFVEAYEGDPYSGVRGWELAYEANKKYQALEPTIGMSAQEVRDSKWGRPTKINKTKNKYGTSEQWVYGSGRYIYLDDGIVTAIQE